MRHWPDDEQKSARIEIIPMIDVMMFLLVFFVLLSLNVIPSLGIKTALPQSSQAEPLEVTTNIIVGIDNRGAIFVEGQEVPMESLPVRLETLKRDGTKLNIIINGDKEVPLQRLIDVMDVLKANGFRSVAIASKQKPKG